MRGRGFAVVVSLALVAALTIPPATAQSDELSEAARIAMAHFGVDPSNARVTDEYTSTHNGVTHVYLRQTVDGKDIADADATVNVQNGVVVFSGSRFVSKSAQISGQQVLSAGDAVNVATAAVKGRGTVVNRPVLLYRKLNGRTVRLAYDVQIATAKHWWNISVDAENGGVLHRYDLVDSENLAHVAASTARREHSGAVEATLADQIEQVRPPEQVNDGSSYMVYAMPLESPLDGGRHRVHNPADASASPFGWHDTNGRPGPEYTITRGNNVNAYADTLGVFAQDNNVGGANEADPASQPNGGNGLDFDHPIITFDATPATYRDAAVDNLFYMNNVMHDVTHRYGFNEEAGNFQETNYTGKGVGNDPVLAEAQDGTYRTSAPTSAPVLNANFSTPPEGSPGRMQMYLWVDVFQTLSLRPEDVVRPYSHQVRDGDLDNGVIAHEYGHGVSNRLVGGPSNVGCLRTHDEREGEGWSDWWSYVMTMRPGDDGRTPRGIGNYVVYEDEGRTGRGIRITPYSTDMRINPSTYNTIKTAAEPHGVGYVWATMLWDLYWNLVDKHGFNPNPYESWETGGNNLALQLVMDGMKFAPCEPGFVDARDAIIAADAALTGDVANGVPGANECLIWRTFARRGLGVNASQGNFESKTDGRDGFLVPEHCASG